MKTKLTVSTASDGQHAKLMVHDFEVFFEQNTFSDGKKTCKKTNQIDPA